MFFDFLSKTLYRRLLTRIEAIEDAQEAQYDRFKRRESTELMREARSNKKQGELELEAAQILAISGKSPADNHDAGSKAALFRKAKGG